MKLLLDTNAYSEFRRGDENVGGFVRKAQRVLLSAVVVGELLYGFRRGRRFQENRRELEAFLASPWVSFLPVSLVTADRFGMIAATLRKKGTPVPTNDIWIAAHAMEWGADLLSFDPHFGHIEGLAWIQPTESR